MRKRNVRRLGPIRRGFTLIEVMIVIAIILLLSGLVGIAVFSRMDEAREQLTETDMNTLRDAIREFYRHFDRVPTTEEGLEVLWSRQALDDPEEEDRWRGYLESPLPEDRWGNEWEYEQLSRTSYRIVSFGPDGEEGTDDDISLRHNVLGYDEEEEEEGDFLPPPGGS